MSDEAAEREQRYNAERQYGYDLARGATFNDARVRYEYATPLLDRLQHVGARIARMCREGKPPAMSIPAKAYDDDMFITAAVDDAVAALRAADAAAWSADMEAAKSQGLVDIWRLPTADRPLGPIGRVPNCRWRESSGEWGYLPCITRPGEFNVLDGNLVAWRPLPPAPGDAA